MAYSLDLRKRVLDFIAAGGSKTASRRFSVARSTLYKWLNAPDSPSVDLSGDFNRISMERRYTMKRFVFAAIFAVCFVFLYSCGDDDVHV